MVRLTYTISEDEFMHAARVLWAYRGIGDRGNWVLAALSAVAGAALLGYGFQTGWIWLGAAALFAGMTLLRNALWRRAYPRLVKYTAPITASFTASEVETTSAQGHTILPWSTFRRYAETPDYFFLFLNRRDFSIIPKSAAPDPLQIEALRELITANLPRAKMRWT